ncbi:sugar (and other) transporter family protein [Francisella philomiragia subsp. philomiragia ATCC 25015]|uniref:MFS transporter n=1 Tax=Francisella philomiragia TaxID=28110 RepID=UPI0001AF7B08|nr:MFS transporter [Francisella philomiragia]AJI74314.1 sugar (and other) transporter family protein [Francisella philomiragia subsp. philomiragia ATCC 25015]EET21960.1 predicted protein [Francisella philomiragia subsp. philomiragia ATCC 25015]MBK2238660.1 MFS transporter [Francisella philomiragia]
MPLLKYEDKHRLEFSVTNVFTCLLFSTLFFLDFVMQTSFSINLKEFKSQLSLDSFYLGLLGSSFLMGYILMQLPIGFLLTIFRVKTVMLSFIVVTIIGNIIIILSNDFYNLFIGRFLTGSGCAIAYIGAAYAVTHWWPNKYEGFGYALILALGSLGGFVGQDIFSLFLQYRFSWEYTTVLSIVFSLIILFIVIFSWVENAPDESFENVKKLILVYLLRHYLIKI